MRIVAGCSRWTNSSRSMAVHIQKDNKNLCGKEYRNGNNWSEELNAETLKLATCKKCLSKYKKLTEE